MSKQNELLSIIDMCISQLKDGGYNAHVLGINKRLEEINSQHKTYDYKKAKNLLEELKGVVNDKFYGSEAFWSGYITSFIAGEMIVNEDLAEAVRARLVTETTG